MNTPRDSLLGREAAYPAQYAPGLLFPIPRAAGRSEIGLATAGPAPAAQAATALPFTGHDRWHAYELGWLDAHGKPRMATGTILVPFDTPNLVESKSMKLYLNSLNGTRFDRDADAFARITADLSACAGGPITVVAGLPPVAGAEPGFDLDTQAIEIDTYGPPDPGLLKAGGEVVEERLYSRLLKSNCPVTGQPDWASIALQYRGPAIDRAGLLRYLVSFRDHAGFHEQCVERIFADVLARCGPASLSVEARYTRRGGLDINPWRGTPGTQAPDALRDARQ